MSKIWLIAGIISFLFCSCIKEKIVNDLKINKVEISMCSICGWCAGGDSLLITEEITYYELNKPCDQLTKKKESETVKSDWDELTDLLDLDEFQQININTCNVCFDGCDTWITVNNGGNTHTIRFGTNDSLVIASIQPFVDKLKAIRTIKSLITDN